MNTASFILTDDDYIRAAPDTKLSSTETHLLATLLSEEDQHDYNQLLKVQLSYDIHHTLYQVRSYSFFPIFITHINFSLSSLNFSIYLHQPHGWQLSY
jgi:hypothetical protein